MIKYSNGWLEQYREAIRKHEIIAGRELIDELDRLLSDMDDDRYIYDCRDADRRIDFMENCIRLTKSPFYGQPMKLMLWQKAFITAVYSFKMADQTYVNSKGKKKHCDRFQNIVLLIARKNAKALELGTRIPTPDGDKTMADIHVGDLVFDECGKPVKVIDESEIFHNHDCYEFTFEDGDKVVCDAGHLWTVQTKDTRRRANYVPRSGRRNQSAYPIDNYACITLTAEDIYDAGDFVRSRADGTGKEYKYRVPMAKAVEYPEKELFSPYLLGQWLGNGNHKDNRITCDKDDVDTLVAEIEREGISVCSVNCWNNKYEVRFGKTYEYHKHDVRDALRSLGVLGNKHIPEEYFTAAIPQRYDLLKGLMDSDGTCNKAGQCSFTQSVVHMQLINDMSRLLVSLGIKHNMAKRTTRCGGKEFDSYEITFYVDKEHSCFRYERKTARLKDNLATRMDYKSIVDIRKVDSVDTKCIHVEGERGLFLCGEKNTVTHNSETCSGLALTESLVGNEGADIVCSSNDDNQANILYDSIDTMRSMIDPDNRDTKKTIRNISIFVTNSKIFKISDKTKNKEGRNIDFAIIDEVHEMKTNVIIKSIEQSQSLKDNPKSIIITTEGFVNDGALDEILRQCRAVINGEDDGIAAERLLPWLYTQDSEQEIWTNPKSWQKSNPSLGIIKKYSYLEKQVDQARKSKSDRLFVLAKDFNMKQNFVQAWLNIEDYTYEAKFDPEDFRGAICLGAVDLSETTDMTSAKILLMHRGDKTKYVLSHYWIPENKLRNYDDAKEGAHYKEWAKEGLLTICEGNDIDLSVVADWFYMLYKTYGIRLYKCGYDQKFSKDFLRQMEEYGFECDLVMQNRQTLSNAIKLVEQDLQSRYINYNEHPIDKWCLGNASIDIDNLGNVLLVKIPGQQGKRIDGAVTFVILYEEYRRCRSEFTAMMK